MKSKGLRFPILFALFTLTGSAAWAGGAKVKVCHIPPGNPANFHTLTVSQNALRAHLDHGDPAGECFRNCDLLCDEDNPCDTGECSCFCATALAGYRDALNGGSGALLLCQQSLFPDLDIDSVTLTYEDGLRPSSAAGPAQNGCGIPPSFNSLTHEMALACSSLLRRTATAAGVTCVPF